MSRIEDSEYVGLDNTLNLNTNHFSGNVNTSSNNDTIPNINNSNNNNTVPATEEKHSSNNGNIFPLFGHIIVVPPFSGDVNSVKYSEVGWIFQYSSMFDSELLEKIANDSVRISGLEAELKTDRRPGSPKFLEYIKTSLTPLIEIMREQGVVKDKQDRILIIYDFRLISHIKSLFPRVSFKIHIIEALKQSCLINCFNFKASLPVPLRVINYESYVIWWFEQWKINRDRLKSQVATFCNVLTAEQLNSNIQKIVKNQKPIDYSETFIPHYGRKIERDTDVIDRMREVNIMNQISGDSGSKSLVNDFHLSRSSLAVITNCINSISAELILNGSNLDAKVLPKYNDLLNYSKVFVSDLCLALGDLNSKSSIDEMRFGDLLVGFHQLQQKSRQLVSESNIAFENRIAMNPFLTMAHQV